MRRCEGNSRKIIWSNNVKIPDLMRILNRYIKENQDKHKENNSD